MPVNTQSDFASFLLDATRRCPQTGNQVCNRALQLSTVEANVEADPQVLLVLIAIRLSGTRPVPAAAEPFKMLKKVLQAAKDGGFVVENEVTTTDAKGKPSKKKTKILELTAAGESLLRSGAGPEIQAAIAAQEKAALVKALEADRAALRHEVVAALSAKPKGKTDDPAKVIGELGKTVMQMAEKLATLETKLQARDDDAVLARIDQAFAVLQQKVGAVAASPTTSSPVGAPVAPQASLAATLRQAYRTLRQFAEFNDGLVPIPRLYHEARRSMPNLSVEALHRELQTLWERRDLELKVLNEVRMATEPDKGITRGENLFYYVFWQNP
jgi:hypothetical protein